MPFSAALCTFPEGHRTSVKGKASSTHMSSPQPPLTYALLALRVYVWGIHACVHACLHVYVCIYMDVGVEGNCQVSPATAHHHIYWDKVSCWAQTPLIGRVIFPWVSPSPSPQNWIYRWAATPALLLCGVGALDSSPHTWWQTLYPLNHIPSLLKVGGGDKERGVDL